MLKTSFWEKSKNWPKMAIFQPPGYPKIPKMPVYIGFGSQRSTESSFIKIGVGDRTPVSDCLANPLLSDFEFPARRHQTRFPGEGSKWPSLSDSSGQGLSTCSQYVYFCLIIPDVSCQLLKTQVLAILSQSAMVISGMIL